MVNLINMHFSYRKNLVKNNIYLLLCQHAVYVLKLYYKLNNRLFSDYRSRCLKSFSKKRKKDFFVLQIGANDGFDNDPIHKFIMRYGWKGLLIEPQPKVFNKFLKKTYSRFPQLELLNAALSNEVSQQILYSISFSDHRWATGLSRFEKDSFSDLINNGYIASQAKLQGVKLPNSVDDYLVPLKVNTVNFDFILQKYGIVKIDFLQIDAEGYDFEILKLFPFNKIKPRFINLEYSHFDEQTKKECDHLLFKNNYKCVEVDFDLFCVLLN